MYQYTPYQDRSVGSIAELLQRRGDIAARQAEQVGQIQGRAAEQSGQAWAGAIGNIGQMVGQLPGQMQQAKRAQMQDEMGGIQLTQAKRAETARTTLASVMQDTPKLSEDGVSVWDVPAITRTMADRGFGPEAGGVAAQLDGINNAFRQARAAQTAVVKTGAQAVAAGGNDPVLANHFLDQLEANKLAPTADIAKYREFIGSDPANTAKLTAYLMGPQKPTIMKPGEQAFDGANQPIPGMSVPEKPAAPTTASIALGAAGGDPKSAAAMELLKPPAPQKNVQSEAFMLDGKPVKGVFDPVSGTYRYNGEDVTARVKPIPPAAAANANPGGPGDVKEFVSGMRDGSLPPQMPGRASKDYTSIMAEAHRQGFDLQAAVTDWNATQKHIATMNGSQQLKLNQSINALPDMLDKVDALASQWKGGQFPVLNKANLALAKGGAYGPAVASVANQLDAQIADVTADLGNVYMGGNSPTDHALGLAGKSLSGDWSEKVLHDMVKLAKSNVTIRSNSMKNTGVAGASAGNPYAPPQTDAPKPKGDPLGLFK